MEIIDKEQVIRKYVDDSMGNSKTTRVDKETFESIYFVNKIEAFLNKQD